MNISEATRIVKERQDAFLRGEMPEWEIEYLKKEYPNAVPDWLRMKANLQVRIRKFRKQYLAVIRVSVRKANVVKRFGARDENSTLKGRINVSASFGDSTRSLDVRSFSPGAILRMKLLWRRNVCRTEIQIVF